jgi:hypothetical protein
MPRDSIDFSCSVEVQHKQSAPFTCYKPLFSSHERPSGPWLTETRDWSGPLCFATDRLLTRRHSWVDASQLAWSPTRREPYWQLRISTYSRSKMRRVQPPFYA